MPQIVNTEWKNWLAENIERGVVETELVDIMFKNQFNRTVAQQALAQVKRELQKKNVSTSKSNFVEITVRKTGEAEHQQADAQHTENVQEHHQVAHAQTQQFTEVDANWKAVVRYNDPVVVVYDNVLTQAECDMLVEMSKPKLAKSTVVDNETGGFVDHEHRKSQGTYFMKGELDFINRIDERLSVLMDCPYENQESIQILNYQVGGEYKPHFDYFPPEVPGSKVLLQHGGQRTKTLIMYLNEVDEGGETIFPELGLSVVPKKGRAVYFEYFNNGEVDPRTLHGGNPVAKGEKWIATKWIREHKF